VGAVIKRTLVVYRELSRLQPYLAALAAAGLDAVPVVAGPGASLSGFDGLVLVGGTDVDPMRYGETPQPETDPPDGERDAAEFTLLEQALAQDLPVLAICRGLQLVNVFHGGTLIQHLNSAARHSKADGDRSLAAHAVTIQPGTLLSSIAGTPTWQVNSRHHQAVKTLGKGLRVSAVDAQDGVVEALERPDKRFLLAVQWHPEDQAPRDPQQAKLFQAFGAAVGG
jgi:putative glutamine amidotransferase